MSPSRASCASDGRSLRERRDDRQPFGRVVQREAEIEQRAERRLAERERGADRQALAEVVQADADGDQQRQHRARASRPLRAVARRPCSHAPNDFEREVRADGAPTRTARRPDTTPGSRGRRSRPSCAASIEQEHQQADGQRQQDVDARCARAGDTSGNHSRPSATGITPTYSPISVNSQR